MLKDRVQRRYEHALLAPVAEAVMPAVLFIPSLGAGFGVPVRVSPETEVGIRGQLTLMYGAGVALSVDYYPSDDDWQTTLMGQIGL